MSEFIEKEITFKRKGRNYYTNSYYSHIIASNMEIDRTVPAGIPPVPSGEAAVSFIEPNASGQPVRGRVIYEEQTNTEEQQNADMSGRSFVSSNVRFYNFTGVPINVSVNGNNYPQEIKPLSGSGYVSLEPGIYTISFYDKNGTELYEYRFRALPGMTTTLVLSGERGVYGVSDISGSVPGCFYNTAYVRFVQLSPIAPAMDIYIDGIPVIAGLKFSEASAFVGVPSGVHRITAAASGTGILYVDESYNFPAFSVSSAVIYSKGENSYALSLITDKDACIRNS
ncbi:MAG: DUF4397 domain-containing protein [Clostridia bacterium]|nr:DUF4397 domain-containing protein [Clostridia bacterium]